MQSHRNMLIVGLLIVALLALAIFARPQVMKQQLVDGENVHVGQTYLQENTVTDSLFVMAETIHLTDSSGVTGDAALVGGDVRVDGQIEGSLAVTGSTVEIGADAHITGDLSIIGSEIMVMGRVDGNLLVTGDHAALDPDAQIGGDVIACVDGFDDLRGRGGELQPCSAMDAPFAVDMVEVFGEAGGTLTYNALVLLGLLSTLILSMLLCGLAALSVALFPIQISRIEEAIRIRPRSQFLNGIMVFLVVIAVVGAAIVLLASVPALGALLLPALLIFGLLFAGMALAGMITLSIVFGEWLLNRVSRAEWPPFVAAAVGSVALSLLLHLPIFIPYGGMLTLIALAVLSVVAVGAALSTRMGTRSSRQSYFVQG